MATLSRKLEHLGFTVEQDFELQDDGNGPYVRRWKSETAQPSQTAIDAVTDKQTDLASLEAALRRDLDESKALKALLFAVADVVPGTDRSRFVSKVRAIYRTLLQENPSIFS